MLWFASPQVRGSNAQLAQLKITAAELQLGEALKSPAPVFQPLPATESAALPVLFFLHMPKGFQVLSRLSVVAQQMLFPRAHTVAVTGGTAEQAEAVWERARAPDPQTSWVEYYNAHTSRRPAQATKVELNTLGTPPQLRKVQKADVMQYASEADGVWHPDSLKPIMMWQVCGTRGWGGGGS